MTIFIVEKERSAKRILEGASSVFYRFLFFRLFLFASSFSQVALLNTWRARADILKKTPTFLLPLRSGWSCKVILIISLSNMLTSFQKVGLGYLRNKCWYFFSTTTILADTFFNNPNIGINIIVDSLSNMLTSFQKVGLYSGSSLSNLLAPR